jgi:hypothetical protein
MNELEPSAPAEDDSGPLRFLRPRDSKRALKARGERRVVNRLRVILPVLSILTLLGLMVWPMLNPDKILKNALTAVPDIVIKNLNYTGADSKGQPYSISAAKATRPSGVANIYDLEKPQGEITLQEGAWVSGKSLYGRLDKDTNHL